jgi:UDP-2,4-diacetamido-2,4,6-trideoxy-beta-L-altropyranose hydrolase
MDEFAIRVDASNRMGVGHVMRCLSLAESLRARGGRVRFVCREHQGNMAGDLRARSFDVRLLPASGAEPPPMSAAEVDYGSWLGAPQSTDAEQTVQALKGAEPDWLIVDHYALDADWERALRRRAAHVLAIDDLANRSHDCDLMVDQNFSASATDRYRGLLPARCRSLLGPYFAMLRPEYREIRAGAQHRDGGVRRILIFFGGSDPFNLTGKSLDALDDPEFQDVQVDVVIGINNPHRQSLAAAASRRPGTRLYGPQPHLADLMAHADLSIGAGGVTTWERMCVGLPAVVVSIAENQRPACKSLAEAGLIVYAGHLATVGTPELKSALRRALADPAALQEMSSRGQRVVDGWGTERILETMLPSETKRLKLRPADARDVYQYFVWANDADVRAQSIQSGPISFENHQQWFAGKIESSESRLFVMVAGELPVGQIRFDRDDDEEWINYSIDRCFRGRGWASRLVELGMAQIPGRNGMVFRAAVKHSNMASMSVFSRLAFDAVAAEHENGLAFFRFDPSRRAEVRHEDR